MRQTANVTLLNAGIDVATMAGRGLATTDRAAFNVFLPKDVSAAELGQAVKAALSASRDFYGHEPEMTVLLDNAPDAHKAWQAELVKKTGARGKKSLFCPAKSLTIRNMGDGLKLSPSHQETMNGFGPAKTGYSEELIAMPESDEAFGELIRDALGYCTSKFD